MNGFYVEDLLRVGNSKFKKLSEIARQKFETARDEDLSFSFAGLGLRQFLNDYFTLEQSFHL